MQAENTGGRGLSGLTLADRFEAQGDTYVLVEARSRLGGRIPTHCDGEGYFDLDPIWPTEADKAPPCSHPSCGPPSALNGLWDNRLHFTGADVAPTFGGQMEGVLEAAENVLSTLNLQKERLD